MPKGIFVRSRKDPADRFWSKVAKSDGCWRWLLPLHGYHGQFWVDSDAGGMRTAVRAEVWAWEDRHGPIPAGGVLLRQCSEPTCVRPDHFRLGDQWDVRFWPFVAKHPGGCWEWTEKLKNNGYGAFSGTIDGYRVSAAHRFSWVLHNGKPPAGLLVLHRCDNRPCVNPAHLWLGTAKDNTADMIAKGRQKFDGLALGKRRKVA